MKVVQRVRLPALCWLLLGLGLAARPAQAEYLDTTQSIPSGGLGLAGEFQAGLVHGSPLMLRLHQAVGLASGVDLYLREGFGLNGMHPFLFAGGAKWTIWPHVGRRPGLAIWLGGHYETTGVAGPDVQVLVDRRFGRWTPFAGSHFWVDFGNETSQANLRLLGGVRYSLHARIAWLVEAGAGLLGDPGPHFVSTGPRLSL